MSAQTCGCGDEFETLSELRLHQRDECELRVAEHDLEDADLDAVVEEAVDDLLVCDVCGASNDGAQDIGTDETAAGLSVVLTFACSECGAANENTAILGGTADA